MPTLTDRDRLRQVVFLFVKQITRQLLLPTYKDELVTITLQDYGRFEAGSILEITILPKDNHFKISIRQATGFFQKYQQQIRKQIVQWELPGRQLHQILKKEKGHYHEAESRR